MDKICKALTAQHEELDELLSGLTPDEWNHPSRCPGWTVCDVVLHTVRKALQRPRWASATVRPRAPHHRACRAWLTLVRVAAVQPYPRRLPNLADQEQDCRSLRVLQMAG